MKKIILLLAVFVMPLLSFAYDVEIDGIYYNLNDKNHEAEITYKDTNYRTYSGNFIIPETINYNNCIYTITSIGKHAFTSSTITSIKISSKILSIGEYAFSFCNNISNIEIPNNVSVIYNNAFINCKKLEKVKLSNNLSATGLTAFAWCTNLKEVIIPNGVKSISNESFFNCENLLEINLPNSITSIGGGAFKGCTSLTKITFSNNITEIGYGAFQECTSLISFEFPSKLNKIEDNVLNDCSHLTSITIKEKVELIKKSFQSCKNLKDVYCYNEAPPSADGQAFNNSFIEYATLHVPGTALELYKETSPWNNFGTIVAITDEQIEEEQCAKPIIIYEKGKLSFKCETEGADFISQIKNTDIKEFYDADIDLSVTYNISVYATKPGYKDSEVANATLCWIDVEPATEGITSSVTNVSARTVLIQNNGGILMISGAENDSISVYDLSGIKVGEGISADGNVKITTSLHKGNIAIVKIGNKAIKVQLR